MKTSIEYDGVRIPIKIKRERRNSIRYSISGKSVNLLMPRHLSVQELENEVHKVKDWCRAEFHKDPKLLNRFRVIVYTHGEYIRVYGKDFRILIFEENRNNLAGRITKGHDVHIRVPRDAAEHPKNEAIGKLLSRVFSSLFHKDILERVMYYNNTYFNEQIDNVRLKNNQSNWGSCSSKRNINLSSRLLFAPTEVLDYVIVHELAHLKEMNHSPAFWKIVRDVMPDYKEKEKWLSKYGETLKF